MENAVKHIYKRFLKIYPFLAKKEKDILKENQKKYLIS